VRRLAAKTLVSASPCRRGDPSAHRLRRRQHRRGYKNAADAASVARIARRLSPRAVRVTAEIAPTRAAAAAPSTLTRGSRLGLATYAPQSFRPGLHLSYPGRPEKAGLFPISKPLMERACKVDPEVLVPLTSP
jgi:hypothetical protein